MKRRPTQEEVVSWFAEPAGIGRVCGEVSGNLEVIDIDIADLKESEAFEKCLLSNVYGICEEQGIDTAGLSNLSITETPRGGLQIAYRCTEPVSGSQKLARHSGVLDPTTGLFDGKPGYHIETRGEGGYVLSPGSPSFCHPLGAEKYRHKSGVEIAEIVPSITPQVRDIILTVAKWLGLDGNDFSTPTEMKKAESQSARTVKKGLTTNVPATRSSQKNELNLSWFDILEPHGFRNVGSEGSATRWQRPGTESKLSATTNYDGSDLFYPFSPNCHPALEPNRGYNKLAVYAALNFGDHSSESFRLSAKQLQADGHRDFANFDHVDISEAMRETKPNKQKGSFELWSFEDFLNIQAPEDYLCEDVLIAKESCVIGGKEKTLKTTIALDLSISMGSATPFLGRFPCRRRVTTGFLTGESGIPKLQRSLKTIMASKRILQIDDDPYNDEPPAFHISQTLPDLSSEESLDQIRRTIEQYKLEVLTIDPLYLSLGAYAESTSNVAVMGNCFRDVEEIAKETGCTTIVLHHTNRKNENNEPLTLRDLSGAGLAEHSRQWILLSQRIPFDPVKHEHKLWMVNGGSAGHAGKYAIDVREKNDHDEWFWDCQIKTFSQELEDYKAEKQERKVEAEQEKQDEFHKHLKAALLEGGAAGSTINELKQRFSANDWKGGYKVKNDLIQDFIDAGFVTAGKGVRGNNSKWTTYAPAGAWAESSCH